MNIREYIKSLTLSDGQTWRSNCPACGRKNTLTVINDGGSIIYNCYGLGCSATGAVHVGLTAHEIQKRLAKRQESKVEAERETMEIPEYVTQAPTGNDKFNAFVQRWGLQGIRLMYDVKDQRVVFPILYKGRLVDAVGRSLTGATPKWLRYTGTASVFELTYGTPKGVAVVVEDVISAITAAKHLPGVTGLAILGTSLGSQHIEALDDYDRIVVALDRDAVSKTLEFKRTIESWTGNTTKALLLQDDIKYMVEDDMMNLKEAVC